MGLTSSLWALRVFSDELLLTPQRRSFFFLTRIVRGVWKHMRRNDKALAPLVFSPSPALLVWERCGTCRRSPGRSPPLSHQRPAPDGWTGRFSISRGGVGRTSVTELTRLADKLRNSPRISRTGTNFISSNSCKFVQFVAKKTVTIQASSPLPFAGQLRAVVLQ